MKLIFKGCKQVSKAYEKWKNVLMSLNEKERFVIKYRYGIGDFDAQTLETIGAMMNITRERVRQIESKALRKMRNKSNIESLKFSDFF